MIQETLSQKIIHVANLIKTTQHVVAFTGAGISTDSGIPDFRSHDSGLWQGVDPMNVASIFGFKKNPSAFYNWVAPLTRTTIEAKPSAGHMALADLERMGKLDSIITQNIDMLHTRAGNKTIFELHGHMREATCINCFTVYDAKPILHKFLEDAEVPLCPTCGGVLKPNVILFGEQLPIRALQGAQDAARKCDLLIIIGSSLEVEPASDLPRLAYRTGAKIVIINLEPTPADNMAEVVIHARAAEALPAIVRELEKTG
ncbi:MAG: NAD-dependent deacylase [Aggregatilineales bacterium]